MLVCTDIMSARDTVQGRSESSTGYSAVYLVPKGGASFGDCEESFPLLSNRERILNSSDSKNKREMAESTQITPGLQESVQDFKAREDRDPNGLNDDVRVSCFDTLSPLQY